MKSLLLMIVTLGLASPTLANSYKVTLTKDNVLVMNTDFNSTSVAKLAAKAKEMDSILPTKEPLYLVLDSPGGSIDAGIELIENLNNLNRPIHTLTLFSASMGFQTVQGVKRGHRLITSAGTLMSHKARGGFSGEFPGQLDSRYSYYLKRVTNLDKGVVARTKGKHTMQSYAALIENEYWCDGQDCINQGFADMVVNASCDKSLSGTKVESERFVFMGMPIELQLIMSACPVITGIIDYKVLVGGENLFKNEKEAEATRWSSNLEKIPKDRMGELQDRIQEIISKRTVNSKRNVIKY